MSSASAIEIKFYADSHNLINFIKKGVPFQNTVEIVWRLDPLEAEILQRSSSFYTWICGGERDRVEKEK